MTPFYPWVIVALLPLTGIVQRDHRPAPLPVLATFIERVAEYVEIHRQLAAGIGDQLLCADPEVLSRQAADLAAAIREARPNASEGDIFTAAVASAFRHRLAHAARAGAIDLATVASEEETHVEVHAALPWGAAQPASTTLLGILPDVPGELEYRFVGRHLVLLDVRANLVVDVLREALPTVIDAPANLSRGPCDVHPDLPACWM